MMTERLKFRFQHEKVAIQYELTQARATHSRAKTSMTKHDREMKAVIKIQQKKIELLTWKLETLRKLEKENQP